MEINTTFYKQLKGFEGSYLISNCGDLVSLMRGLPKFLKKNYDKQGYVRYGLKKNKKHFTKSAHRLVAENFLQIKNKKQQVHHINANKKDNRVSNLAVVSRAENMNEHYKKNKNYGFSYSKRDKNWRSRITLNGREYFLGTTKEKFLAEWLFVDAYFSHRGFFPKGEA